MTKTHRSLYRAHQNPPFPYTGRLAANNENVPIQEGNPRPAQGRGDALFAWGVEPWSRGVYTARMLTARMLTAPLPIGCMQTLWQ